MLQLYGLAHNKIDGLTNYKELNIVKEINIDETLSFLFPISDPKHDAILEECYIQTKDNEYIVKEVNYSDDDWTAYICKINIEGIKGKEVSHFETVEQTCTNSINLALVGTGWTIGVCDVVKLRTVRKNNCSAYIVLQEIQSAYGCEMYFDGINKKVYIYQAMGSDKGTYFAEQLNLKKLDVQRNSYDYITRLIPLGKDGLGIASINGGLNYIENYQYSGKIITAYWEDNRYTDAQSLMDDGIDRLAYLSVPYKSYRADILDLSSNSTYGILDYSLGDTITLLAKSKDIKERQRIIKLTNYPEEPERNTVEIANKIVSLEVLQVRLINSADVVDTVTTSDGLVDGTKVDGIDWTQLQNVHIVIADIQDLSVVTARIGTLEVTTAHITNGIIDNATIDVGKVNNLSATYATIVNLTATNGNITSLTSNIASINTLLAGNLGAGNIAAGAIIAGSGIIAVGAIGSAQISDLSASKITAGIIDAAIITVKNLTADNITAGTINGQRIAAGAIDNSKVSGTANIDGSKLNISSVVTAVNGGTTNIQANRITINSSTLDVQISSILSTQASQGSTITTQGASITANASTIALKVDTTTYNSYVTTNNSAISTINTSLSTQSSSISVLQGQITLKVTQTDINNSIGAIQVGGRNLLKTSNTTFISAVGWGYDWSTTVTVEALIESGEPLIRLTATQSGNYDMYKFVDNLLSIPLVANQNYVISLDVRTTKSYTNGLVFDKLAAPGQVVTANIPNTNGAWQRISLVINIATVPASDAFVLSVSFVAGDVISFKNIKLEIGNKATDWTPAPEDVQSQIDSATTRISTNEGSITLLNNSIVLKATQTDFTTYQSTVSGNFSTTNTNVTTAQTQANLGVTNAASAQGTANTGVTNALTAQTAANLANTNATALTTRVTTAEATIVTQAGQITLKATQTSLDTTNSNVTGVTTRMTTAEGSITTQAGQISLKVSANGVIASINASPETITIDASNLNLNGLVTITNLLTPGSVVIDGGNIKGGTLTLGGASNVSGIEYIKDGSGNNLIVLSKDGMLAKDGIIQIVSTYPDLSQYGQVPGESRVTLKSSQLLAHYVSSGANGTFDATLDSIQGLILTSAGGIGANPYYIKIGYPLISDGFTDVTFDTGIHFKKRSTGVSAFDIGDDGSINSKCFAGMISYMAMNTPPVGWLRADGAPVSRTSYANLFAAIGTLWGTGNGSTTFNVPDLRGEFIRGLSDGSPHDTGRVFSSYQGSQNVSHQHSITHIWNAYSGGGTVHTYLGYNTSATVGNQFATDNTGGTESRPENIALLACIKY